MNPPLISSFMDNIRKHLLSLIIFSTLFVLTLLVFLDNSFSGYEVGGMYQYTVSLRNGWASGILFPRWGEIMDCGVVLWQQRLPLPHLLPAAFFFLKPIVAIKLFTYLFWIFSGFTMYLWVYSHVKSKPISIISGLIYVFLPIRLQYTLLWGAFSPELHFLLFPLFLLFLEKKDVSRRYVILTTLMFSAIAGTIMQFGYLASLFMGLYMIYELFVSAYNSRLRSFFKTSLPRTVIILVLGLCLASYCWLPSIFSAKFVRVGAFHLTEALIESEYNPLANIVTLKFKKHSLLLSTVLRDISDVHWFDYILPALAAMGILFYWRADRKDRGRDVYFYYIVAAISIVVGLGNPVVWQFLRDYVPHFSSMRYPPRLGIFFPSIFYPLFIAYTLKGALRILDSYEIRGWMIKLPVREIKLRVICIAVALLMIALPSFLNFRIAISNPLVFNQHQQKIPLDKLSKDGRIMVNPSPYGPWDGNNIEIEIVYRPYLWVNGKKTVFGVDTVNIHKNLLVIPPHEANEKAVVFGMMNARYMMTIPPVEEKDMGYLELVEPKSDASDLYIYELKRYVPEVSLTRVVDYPFSTVRGWAVLWVYNTPFDRVSFLERDMSNLIYEETLFRKMEKWVVSVSPSLHKVYETLVKNPLKMFGIYNEIPVDADELYKGINFLHYNYNGNNMEDIKPIDGRCEVIKRNPERIELNVDLNESAMLMFNETHWPGWNARVDGKLAHIYTVNGMFMGVYLPPGKHIVEIWYGYAWYETIALILTFLSAFVLGLYWVKYARKAETAEKKDDALLV